MAKSLWDFTMAAEADVISMFSTSYRNMSAQLAADKQTILYFDGMIQPLID